MGVEDDAEDTAELSTSNALSGTIQESLKEARQIVYASASSRQLIASIKVSVMLDAK